jgi:hypothetical protein
MIPIQDLLSRIRRDPEFAKGEFVIGCDDRIDANARAAAAERKEWRSPATSRSCRT